MIPVHMEPKGLDRDEEALQSNYPELSRKAAARGSAMLRDAILRLHGFDRPRRCISVSKCCDKCGSPLEFLLSPVNHIQATVAAYYSLPPGSMTSQRRARDIARPRQVAMYLASELTTKSLPELGRRFGNRDHTTVMYAIKAVERRVDEDPELAEDVTILRRVLEKVAA